MKSLLAALHRPIYEKRVAVLVSLIQAHLRDGDRVLDIGSGSGVLGRRLLEAASTAGRKISVRGLEKHPRGGEAVETLAFDGYRIPSADGAHEVVILADVVHHEEDYETLLREAVRVCGRFLILKDHTPCGFLGHARTCFMDWAANNPYGVPCLYRYFQAEEWRTLLGGMGMEVVEEHRSLRLYPEPFNFVFGNRLQYFAVFGRDA